MLPPARLVLLAVAFSALSCAAPPAEPEECPTPTVQDAGGFQDGNQLLGVCGGAASAICQNYLLGVVDTLVAAGVIPFSCVEGASVVQFSDAVAQGLEDNPGDRAKPAAFLAGGYIREAFGCE